jgi:hypothetical protein
MPEGCLLVLAILDGFSVRNEQGGVGREDSIAAGDDREPRGTYAVTFPAATTAPTGTHRAASPGDYRCGRR